MKKPIMSMLEQYLQQVKTLESIRGIPEDLHFIPTKNVMYVSKNDECKKVLYGFCKEVNIPYYKMDFKCKDENQIKIERM